MSLPRVLVVHNHYQQPGGEDQVFRAEADLLRRHGHAVFEYTADNRDIDQPSLRTALETIWSADSARRLRRVLKEFRPDIAHFHNTFPLISPSAYYACQQAGVRVVQSVHHYRWGCPSANLYRDGHVCEDCLGKSLALPGVLHACYHDSHSTSAVIALMNLTHRVVGTWSKQVDRYIALSRFQREKLIAAGLPAERIAVKGNFVDPDPGVSDWRGEYVLYVGRLIPEKGLSTLLHAWRAFDQALMLKIVGDGPRAREVVGTPGVEWLGRRPSSEVHTLMAEAMALMVPSEWHEPFGLVAIEAFAAGTPVIAARSGALSEVVEHGHTGLLFEPGQVDDLVGHVQWVSDHPRELARMRREARQTFEARYTAERNYLRLLEIYRSVLAARV